MRDTGLLRLDGVGRRYGLRGPWVLRDVTLDVPAGTLLRVEGVNGVVAAISSAHSDDMRTAVPVGPATAAGLPAAAVSVLLGTAVGSVTNPPLLRRSG